MNSKKMSDLLKLYTKEEVFESYFRIMDEFKDYDKITKNKMLSEIYKVYSDYNNIIEICTTKELKYLEMIINNCDNDELFDNKYFWERNMLDNKFLIQIGKDVFIPEEIIDTVTLAIKNVKWNKVKKLDELNEILIGYIKIQGVTLLLNACNVGATILNLDPKDVLKHMLNNKLFNYHVSIITEDIELLGNDVPVVLHNDFYDLKDEIEKLRKEKEITSYGKIDKKLFRTYFYNDFDINNKNVNKLIDAVKQLPFSYSTILDDIKICAMLDEERGPLVYFIQVISNSYDYDASNILELLDKAMDEIPSGVLNGLSRNQLLKLKQKELEVEKDKLKNYKLQEAACLSKEDAKLFYKLYFALLEFTNEKYNINKHLKIYNRTGINPNDLTDIVDTFWENKDELINEFCTLNPYKFNNEELDLIKKFKEGKRGMYFIMKYEEEYTTFMYQDRIYMVKGINVNIDNIIPYDKLPYPVVTTILPFKKYLIYDSLFKATNIKLSIDVVSVLNSLYSNLMKYYHM